MPGKALHLETGVIMTGTLVIITHLAGPSLRAPGGGEVTPSMTITGLPLTEAVAGVPEAAVGVIRVAVGVVVSRGPEALHLLTSLLEVVSTLILPLLKRLGQSFSLQKLFLCSLLLV